MPIARQMREVTPTGQAPPAVLVPSGINAAEFAAQRGLAGALSQSADFLANLNDKLMQIDITNEISSFEGFINEQRRQSIDFRNQNEDTIITAADGNRPAVTAYTQDWDSRLKAINDYNAKLKYKASRDNGKNLITKIKPIWQSEVDTAVNVSRVSRAIKQQIEFEDSVIESNVEPLVRAENAYRTRTGQSLITEKQYKLSLINNRLDDLRKAGVIDAKDIPARLAMVEIAIDKGQTEQIKQLIFQSFNNVLKNPTTENIKLSQDLIDKSGLDEEEKYRLSRTLLASFNEGKQKQTEQYKAYREQQSAAVGNAISTGESIPIEQEFLPEVQNLTDILVERRASGDLNSRDDTTYNFIRDNIMTGKYYNQNDLLEAYATGLSTEQYQTLIRENEENKKLSDATKELLGMYNTDITERTDNVRNAMVAIAPKNIPLAYAALYKHKRDLMGEIRSMVLKGEPSEKIFTKIAAAYTADTEGFWKNWFRQIFTNWGVNDFSNELIEASKWDDRYAYLIELLKKQENYGDINLLIEKWERDDLIGSETSNFPTEPSGGFLLLNE